MVTREELKGHWNEVTGRLKEHWAQLTDDDLMRVVSQTGDYSAKVAETVRTKPKESLAIAFGLGIAAGALFFMGRKR